MIQVKIKKIVMILILFVLVGCNTVVDGSDKFHEVLNNMNGINNYSSTTITTNKYSIDSNGTKEEVDSEVVETYKTDGNIAYSHIKTVSSLGDDTEEDNYFKDGYYYISNDSGKYLVQGNQGGKVLTINSDSIKDGVEKVTLKNNGEYSTLDITYTKEKQDELYGIYAMEFGLTVEDITYKPYVFRLKVDDKVIEEETVVEYSYKGKNTSINVYSKSVTTFDKYGEESLALPDDIDSYKPVNGSTSGESIEEKLVSILNYVKSGNRYELIYNENETYLFDFDLNIFTYKIGIEAYSYNWKNQLGTYDKCTVDFKNDSTLGTCTKDDIENIKATKGYLEVELLQIDETMEELLKVGE